MFELQTSNLCEARFLVSDLKFVVVTKVSLGQTDDDDAVNLDELMNKVAMRVAGYDVVSAWVVWGAGTAGSEFVCELDLVIWRLWCAKIISRSRVREYHFAQSSARISFRAVRCAKIISRSQVRENHFAQSGARKSFRAVRCAKVSARIVGL